MTPLAGVARRVHGRVGRVAVNTAVSALRTMVRLAVGFALLPLLLDGIGPARTGLFLFSTTLTGYFTAVDNSIGSSVTRYVAEHRARREPDKVAATVKGSLAVMTGVGLIAAVGLAIVALTASDWLFRQRSLHGVAEPTILVAALTMVVYWPSRVGVAALNGLERYDQAAWIQIGTALLLLGSFVILSRGHASVVVLTAVFGAIASLEGFIGGALAWHELGVDRRWRADPWFRGDQLRAIVGFSAAAFVIGIGATLVSGFDRAIVGATVSAAAIVGYDLAQRPQSAVQTIAGLSGLALISPVARLHALGRHERMRELVLLASLVSILVTAPIAVLTMVLAHPFVVAWIGSRYGRDAGFIDVFVSFWVLNCSTTALSSALYGIGELKIYARIVIVMSIVSLPLSVVLALAWGTVGVIWGTVIPSGIALPIFLFYALRLLDLPRRDFVRRVLVPGFGPVLVWSVAAVVAKQALEPRGYAGLVAFSVAALTTFWAAVGPSTRDRLRAARPPSAATL